MTRSPLFYPLNRGMDADAGGVADLQTDVMRFIAILALCLVAIFALVQSIPLMPADTGSPDQQAETVQAATPEPKIPEPALNEPIPPVTQTTDPVIVELSSRPAKIAEEPLLITRPAPQRIAGKRTPPKIIEQTVEPQPANEPPPATEPQAVGTNTEAVQKAASVPLATQSEGFTLRFETDLALTRMVARNEVGFYAITPDKSLRMNVNRGSFNFWPASVPNQFHEMDKGTVPDEVLSALRRAGSVEIADVKWGVTLPKNMRSELDQYLSGFNGGSLIIGGDGSLRLEH